MPSADKCTSRPTPATAASRATRAAPPPVEPERQKVPGPPAPRHGRKPGDACRALHVHGLEALPPWPDDTDQVDHRVGAADGRLDLDLVAQIGPDRFDPAARAAVLRCLA